MQLRSEYVYILCGGQTLRESLKRQKRNKTCFLGGSGKWARISRAKTVVGEHSLEDLGAGTFTEVTSSKKWKNKVKIECIKKR